MSSKQTTTMEKYSDLPSVENFYDDTPMTPVLSREYDYDTLHPADRSNISTQKQIRIHDLSASHTFKDYENAQVLMHLKTKLNTGVASTDANQGAIVNPLWLFHSAEMKTSNASLCRTDEPSYTSVLQDLVFADQNNLKDDVSGSGSFYKLLGNTGETDYSQLVNYAGTANIANAIIALGNKHTPGIWIKIPLVKLLSLPRTGKVWTGSSVEFSFSMRTGNDTAQACVSRLADPYRIVELLDLQIMVPHIKPLEHSESEILTMMTKQVSQTWNFLEYNTNVVNQVALAGDRSISINHRAGSKPRYLLVAFKEQDRIFDVATTSARHQFLFDDNNHNVNSDDVYLNYAGKILPSERFRALENGAGTKFYMKEYENYLAVSNRNKAQNGIPLSYREFLQQKIYVFDLSKNAIESPDQQQINLFYHSDNVAHAVVYSLLEEKELKAVSVGNILNIMHQ